MANASGTLATAAGLSASGQRGRALDIGLAWDATRQGCDLVWAKGDFQLDTTPITAMFLALGCDRRARPEDALPDDGAAQQPAPGQAAPLLNLKRGWAGDALDGRGRRIGSRLWLLGAAKQTEQTRLLAESIAAEALAQVRARFGSSMQIAVRWVSDGILGIRVAAGPVAITVRQRTA